MRRKESASKMIVEGQIGKVKGQILYFHIVARDVLCETAVKRLQNDYGSSMNLDKFKVTIY